MILDHPAFSDLFSPSRVAFNPIANTKLSFSEVNNSQSLTVNPGEGWAISYFYKVIEFNKAMEMRNMLIRLRGHTNTVLCPDPLYKPQLGWLGAPVVDGANQYGLAINVKGLTPNIMCARFGERFVLDGQLNEVVANVISNGSGRAQLILANEHRALTSNNAALVTTVSNLKSNARWLDPNQLEQFSGNKRLYRSISLDFTEAR